MARRLGSVEPAPRRVGIREVADRAGVAIASVSRVLSGHPDASARMRERVLAAIDELGYQPDFLAKSLRTGASSMIGIIVSDICNPMMAAIVKGAELRLREGGYTSMVASSLGDPALEAQHIEMLRQRRVDGLMIALTDEDNAGSASLLSACESPVLLLDRDVDSLSNASAVRFDHSAGFVSAVRHLLELGHRRIALINGFPSVRPSRQRERSLQEAVRGLGEDARVVTLQGAFTAEHGYRATLEQMRLADAPTALISGNNQILIGVLKALRQLDVAIPRDVSLVTCDDVPMADFLQPRLATVGRDVQAMGERAAELMLKALQGEAPSEILLPTTFDTAQSCAAPRQPVVKRPRERASGA